MHCEPIGLTVDHAAGHRQCGQFRRSVRGWHRTPICRGRRPDDYYGHRMRYLDHRHDLARLGGECGSTRGVVRVVWGDECVLRLCAPTRAILSFSTALDIAMMAPMFGLTSEPAELGFVVFIFRCATVEFRD